LTEPPEPPKEEEEEEEVPQQPPKIEDPPTKLTPPPPPPPDISDPNIMMIPKQDYQALVQSNQIAIGLAYSCIDKLEIVLDELSEFETKVRQIKKETKEQFRRATTLTTDTDTRT
jgi:hypothetical protein